MPDEGRSMSTPVAPGRAALVVLAAGSGLRALPDRSRTREDGSPPTKVLRLLDGRPMLWWSLTAAVASDVFGTYVLVARPEDAMIVTDVAAATLPPSDVRITRGGPSRHASEWMALRLLARDVRAGTLDVIALHDAARPAAPAWLFRNVVVAAQMHGGAVPGVPAPPVVPLDPADTLGAEGLVAVQTPQAFRAGALLAAYEHAAADGFEGTDTAACIERYRADPDVGNLEIVCVPGSEENLKVTYPEDFARVGPLLAGGPGE
jgi:2-C-methyl-D-erythritol 4-phosphate cytidylyltransferase